MFKTRFIFVCVGSGVGFCFGPVVFVLLLLWIFFNWQICRIPGVNL